MKINAFSNLTFRALIYMALRPEQFVTTREIADAYKVSFNHLKKVMINLAEHHYIVGTKGRNGGYKLARNSNMINVGEVFRITIENVAIAECFASPDSQCVISPDCRLRHILMDAVSRFTSELDNYCLYDLVKGRQGGLAHHLGIEITEIT
ncbi:RrF2 family transcriptional regulator [Alteromonas facilis]|uniref:RrF2 family transcriptional regulator n=1 Tax=Alteromonas facilis TaxID=2048004 RepID=UPI000C292666|nr:Rrf2 family transcriptional regulator [Alteromonas facilis]